MTKQRLYEGNIPSAGTLIAEGDEWQLYQLPPNKGWMNFKLVSKAPRPFKANYHLGWCNGLARTRDATSLKLVPELHAWASELIASAGKRSKENGDV